jgi:hypothetical protein
MIIVNYSRSTVDFRRLFITHNRVYITFCSSAIIMFTNLPNRSCLSSYQNESQTPLLNTGVVLGVIENHIPTYRHHASTLRNEHEIDTCFDNTAGFPDSATVDDDFEDGEWKEIDGRSNQTSSDEDDDGFQLVKKFPRSNSPNICPSNASPAVLRAPPNSPRGTPPKDTTRRNMFLTELTESLRKNVLYELTK